ncbi:calcium-dependent protein kinase 26 isoform X1 [Salvia hispanica]|uniref:calcium-dependent protein kinase 26 isoform X1 n=2 Tax=Salvia hispanica TaxID=49212 RepID=UPI0020091155|nr:calcium-dependent protein kinase 26 isoform X1 [Salvia hispanica]XP_047950255.1 calcium-dependent protein kinase 26 isoform X1 [Salvia hispanica]
MGSRDMTLTHPFKCFKSSDMSNTILNLSQTGNFRERYVLGDQLGWGRFGIIRECSDKLTGEVLACKSISKERLVTEDDVWSVKLEIDILTKLSGHENVVDLKAVYEEEDYVHLLMELCAGGELFHRIEQLGRLSEHEAHVIFKQLMEVLIYCHDKRIVHRDLKPENILLVSRSSSTIKLADFGLATHIEPGNALRGTVGSPFYIAPEVLAGDYNQAADVWSAGVILYILLSGIPPFWGKTKSTIFDAVRAANLCFYSDIWDHISMSAKDLISGMLCLDPAKRLTAAQVLAHTWTKDAPRDTDKLYRQDIFQCEQSEVGSSSFSNLTIARDQDLSFCNGSPPVVNSEHEDSPTFSCQSSFYSSPMNQRTPSSKRDGVHSGSCCESHGPEFSSPIPSMPSFTFFTPMPAFEPSEESLCFKTKTLSIDKEPNIRKLILLPDSSPPGQDKGEQKSEVRRGGWAAGTSKSTNLQSKRNNTIGVGELDHLDLISTVAAVSRWASCTQIPSATSLLPSLVC